MYRKHQLSRERVVSAKNRFSGAGTLTCVTQEWYKIGHIKLYHNVHQRSYFMTVSISQQITSGRFSQTRSHATYSVLIIIGTAMYIDTSAWLYMYHTSKRFLFGPLQKFHILHTVFREAWLGGYGAQRVAHLDIRGEGGM